jgi:hypothetical protein
MPSIIQWFLYPKLIYIYFIEYFMFKALHIDIFIYFGGYFLMYFWSNNDGFKFHDFFGWKKKLVKKKIQTKYKYVKVWMIIVHDYVIFKAFQIN